MLVALLWLMRVRDEYSPLHQAKPATLHEVTKEFDERRFDDFDEELAPFGLRKNWNSMAKPLADEDPLLECSPDEFVDYCRRSNIPDSMNDCLDHIEKDIRQGDYSAFEELSDDEEPLYRYTNDAHYSDKQAAALVEKWMASITISSPQ